jgi:predicted phosphatase
MAKAKEAPVVDPSNLEVPSWTITVRDADGNVVQTFEDVTAAVEFAKGKGYFIHAA